MTDLATESICDTTANLEPLTLQEKRQQYAEWLASGRRAQMPLLHHHTGTAHTRVDDVEAGNISEFPPDTVVRTDEGNGDTSHVSDDLRLDLAKALLPKIEGSDPAQAERIANAANAILGPAIARADDDADLKNKVLEKDNLGKPTSPGATTKADGEEEKPRKATDKEEPKKEAKEPTLAEVIAALGKLSGRLDQMEAKNDSEDDDDEGSEDVPTRGAPGMEGKPKALAADDDIYAKMRRQSLKVRTAKDKEGRTAFDSTTDHLFFPYQAQADRVYGMLGSSAPKPMHGEARDDYRRRLLTPLQRFSEVFKHADLRVAQVDPIAFGAIEQDIFKAAADAYKNPATVPLGHLREHVETRGGHTYTKFIGRPISWMSAFAPHGKRVKRIIERADAGPGRTLYERL